MMFHHDDRVVASGTTWTHNLSLVCINFEARQLQPKTSLESSSPPLHEVICSGCEAMHFLRRKDHSRVKMLDFTGVKSFPSTLVR
jgi:hypothetical protein